MARCTVMCLNGDLIKVVEEPRYSKPIIESGPFTGLHAEDSLSSESTSNEEPDPENLDSEEDLGLDSEVPDTNSVLDSLSSESTSNEETDAKNLDSEEDLSLDSEVPDTNSLPAEEEQTKNFQSSENYYIDKRMDVEIQENHQPTKISAVFSLKCLHEKEVAAPEVYIKEEPVESENEIINLSNDESENDESNLPDKESESTIKILPTYSESLNVKDPLSAESPSNAEEIDAIDVSEVPDLVIMPDSPPGVCIKQEPVESDSERSRSLSKNNSQHSGKNIFQDSGPSSAKDSSSCPSSSKGKETEILDISEVPDLVMQSVENLSQAELIHISKSLHAEEAKNSPASSSAAAVSVPRNVFTGVHNFYIKFNKPKPSDRSPSSTFCELNKKLYVAKHQPFEVLVCAQSVPIGAVIKVCAVFSKLEYQNEIVVRCPTHAQIDCLTGRQEYDHMVQCVSPFAYYSNNNGVRSVSVPYEAPPAGQSHTSYVFKLTCFSSCLGSVYKRSFKLLFTLEKYGTVLGRDAVETRVCACPLRDSKNEIRKEMPDNEDLIKNEDKDDAEKQNYSITVTDPMLYQFLKEMQNLYEANSIAKKLKKS